MIKPSEDTVYCLRHGWVELNPEIGKEAGVFVSVCGLCGTK